MRTDEGREKKQVIVDGNDGTGKSTLVKTLLGLGYNAIDRGIPTKMTDDNTLNVYRANNQDLFVILDVTVEESRKRLGLAGKDLTEKYHTFEDLTYYREQYRQVATRMISELGMESVLYLNVTYDSPETVLALVVDWLSRPHGGYYAGLEVD